MKKRGKPIMPYCPKCDMEFVDGITTCSDCGGTLVASKEIADAMKKQEAAEAEAHRQAEYEAMQAEFDMAAAELNGTDDLSESGNALEKQAGKTGNAPVRHQVYVKKSQQYDDLKSSASAFVLVGGILLIFSALTWMKVINLPMTGISRIISQSVMTVLGIGSLIVAISSAKSAKTVKGQIAAEENTTRELIQWFTDSYRGDKLDEQIFGESGDLTPEELSLKRFELIQDILVTTHDLTNQAYVDLIAEDIYARLYQD